MTDSSRKTSLLVMVRHGETDGESSIRYNGRTDVALSEFGRQQIEAVRKALHDRFGGDPFAPIFTSPLSRAIESALIIAGASARLIKMEDLTEIDFGWFETLTAEEIKERYPTYFSRWESDRFSLDYTYPGGESRRSFHARIDRAIRQIAGIIDENGAFGPHSLLVAHRGVIRAMIQAMVDERTEVDLGSIQILSRSRTATGKYTWQPVALDLTDHLAG